ncbi:hypothetical protein TNCT_701691 [Trichonephila clavata]|nr:hypothetical protein TNCT_701691 [Trichonephila clavata]
MTSFLTADEEWKNWSADGYAGKWASYIYIVDYAKKEIVHKLALEQDDAALSLCIYIPVTQSTNYHIFVGVTRNMELTCLTRTCRSASIYSYEISSDCTSLKLLHINPVNGIPTAFCIFYDNLLVGISRELHFF